MKISVIIPVYNVEKYLERCLDSALSQTFDNYEVIAVDDGSTDRCPDILKNYSLRFPDKLRTIRQDNRGLGEARNTGILYAEGEYLLFLDSDDWIMLDALKEIYECVSATDADLLIFDAYVLTEKNVKIDEYKGCHNIVNVFSLREYPQMLLELPCAWNKLYKKYLFTKTGIRYPSQVWYEDLRTSGKIYLEADKIVILNKPLYNYVQREKSIMHNYGSRKNLEIIEAIEEIVNYYRNRGLHIQYKDELEFLAVRHILLAAIPRIIRADYKSDMITILKDYVKDKFPEYKSNKYIDKMPNIQKLKLYLIIRQHYKLLSYMYFLKKEG